jgi:hypothetical protein
MSLAPGYDIQYSVDHTGVGGRHEMPNPCWVENAIVCREDGPAASSLDSLTCGVSARSSKCSNCCCPAEPSARGSRSRCSWDEALLRGVTLPRDGADTAIHIRTAPLWEPVANMKGSAAGFQATLVRSPPPRDCGRTWCSSVPDSRSQI